MRQIALSSVAILLASGFFSITSAAPTSQAIKRAPQDAAVSPSELVVIPIEDTDTATVPVGARDMAAGPAGGQKSPGPTSPGASNGPSGSSSSAPGFINTPPGPGTARRSAHPQTDPAVGLDTLVVIPIEDPEVPLPAPVDTGSGAVSGFVKKARKVRKAL
ncbi:hypothetical protein QBC37DRAFT_416849 [Rhypophila decipiens]|uniref:Uncharacterized protein n=1 Tax=Rhypophila decipiens TaxID=261697 RepID=A0AAN6YH06_9PEZI|nr:hypothetical protein QBC37DRAFT_416849 [Rhypophila decipiens]